MPVAVFAGFDDPFVAIVGAVAFAAKAGGHYILDRYKLSSFDQATSDAYRMYLASGGQAREIEHRIVQP